MFSDAPLLGNDLSKAESVIGFLTGRLPSMAEEIDNRNELSAEFLQGLREAGAFDSLSMSLSELMNVVRVASRWSPAVAHVIMTSATVARRVRQDGRVYSLCVTEPGGGSDIKANLKTIAEERAGGEAYVTGEKVYASNAIYASHFLVLAQGPSGPTLYLVERGPGIKVEKQELFTFRGAGVSKVAFEGATGVRVGTPGKGIRETLETINYERLGYGAIGLGIKDGFFEEVGPKALTKKIFGVELGDYQGIRWYFADVEIRSRLLEALLEVTVARAESKGAVDPYDAAVSKLMGAEVAQRAAWLAVQVMGGAGFARGSRLERLTRDSRMLDIGAGAREVLLDFVGEQAIKRYRGH
jgi:alkylation response protein AidB-like acyl-CoA dehydrogenase